MLLIKVIDFNKNSVYNRFTMKTDGEKMTISAQIPIRLAKKLSALSAAENRSKSYYIKESLEQFIAHKMQDVSDYLEGEALYREFLASGEQAVSLDAMAQKYNLAS